MAIRLAKKNIDVVVIYATNKEKVNETVEAVKALGGKDAALQLDLNDFRSLDNFINLLSNTLKVTFNVDKYDYLINNAGMVATVSFEKMTE